MYTNNYSFQSVNVIKIILQNKEGKILLIQEPKDNNWMPLHWGLPGGKPTETESLQETFARKCRTDIGQCLKINGLFKIEELLMKGKTAVMYIVVSKTENNVVSGDANEYKWVSKEDIKKMPAKEFTEFYNKSLLLDFLENPNNCVPFALINTLNYYEMADDSNYKEWSESGGAALK